MATSPCAFISNVICTAHKNKPWELVCNEIKSLRVWQQRTGGDTLLQTDRVGTWSLVVGIYGFGPSSVIQTCPRGVGCPSRLLYCPAWAELEAEWGSEHGLCGCYRQTVSSEADSGFELQLWFVDVITEWSMLPRTTSHTGNHTNGMRKFMCAAE